MTETDCTHIWVKERFIGMDSGDDVCARCNATRKRPRKLIPPVNFNEQP